MKNRRHTGSVYDCGIIGFPVFRDVRYLNALCRGRIKNNLPASCRRKAGIAVDATYFCVMYRWRSFKLIYRYRIFWLLYFSIWVFWSISSLAMKCSRSSAISTIFAPSGELAETKRYFSTMSTSFLFSCRLLSSL